MKPWLLKTAEEYKGRIKFVAVSSERSGEVFEEYGVSAMPTFVAIKDGKEINRLRGADKDGLKSMIEESL